MFTALFRVLEISNGKGFIPVGVIVGADWTGPFGTSNVKRSDDCECLPIDLIMADLVLWDQAIDPKTNLATISVPDRYASAFRLTEPNSMEVTDSVDNAVDFVFTHAVLSNPFYETHPHCTRTSVDLARAA